jgi:hypothetical protein
MGLTSQSSSVVVASIHDVGVARGVASLLTAQHIHAEVVAGASGISGARVWDVKVPSVLSERARLILTPTVLSEAELNYLAAGALPNEDTTK